MDRSNTSVLEETTELQRELDRLRADLRQIRSDLASLGGDAVRAARVGFNESMKNASAQGKAVADGAGKQIAAHPFLTITTALAIGMLLGYRSGRRD